MIALMKKWCAIFMLFYPTLCAAFTDISPDDPDLHSFVHLGEVGVMYGYQDGSFRPSQIVTRAEAITVALRAGGIAIPTDFDPADLYDDVDPNTWYAPSIARAKSLQLIARQTNLFRPNDAITKAEFLTMICRTTRISPQLYASRTKDIANDIDPNAWYAPFFAYAKQYQIAHLPANNFYLPDKALTRREVALMTHRQHRLIHGGETTRRFIELQAKIDQFIALQRAGKGDEAQMHLQRIIELTDTLTRSNNNQNAVAAKAISRAMKHLSKSLTALRFEQNLTAIENLHLAAKNAERAREKSEELSPFADELIVLIDETLQSIANPHYYTGISQAQ